MESFPLLFAGGCLLLLLLVLMIPLALTLRPFLEPRHLRTPASLSDPITWLLVIALMIIVGNSVAMLPRLLEGFYKP